MDANLTVWLWVIVWMDVKASIKSNIQWSKTSKVLGGLSDDASDKVTSAIVSLFSRAEGMKK